MGKAGMPFFGNIAKAELEKAIKDVDAAIEAATTEDEKLELEAEKAKLLKALDEAE